MRVGGGPPALTLPAVTAVIAARTNAMARNRAARMCDLQGCSTCQSGHTPAGTSDWLRRPPVGGSYGASAWRGAGVDVPDRLIAVVALARPASPARDRRRASRRAADENVPGPAGRPGATSAPLARWDLAMGAERAPAIRSTGTAAPAGALSQGMCAALRAARPGTLLPIPLPHAPGLGVGEKGKPPVCGGFLHGPCRIRNLRPWD